MAVDPYSPCPCGSGKKLKFCCPDLATDIEKVHRMLEGDQPRAALAHLDATLAKAPGKASLLDLKASIELSLGDSQAAARTVEQYLRVDPENPGAHAQAALAAATATSDDQAAAALLAVDHLQSALERVADSIAPRVLQAIGATGQALLGAGDLIAARAHLWLYQGIAGEEDTRAMELLMRLNQVGGLPLVLRDTQFLREPPAGHPCEAEHDHAQLLASRGQWRRAAEKLHALAEQHPELPTLKYNAAVVSGWLGDQAKFVEGLRAFARQINSEDQADDAIEAEAIAQILDEQLSGDRVDVVRSAFTVNDEEALLDRLARDARITPHQLGESELRALEGPQPRSAWLLLDRELPESGVDLAADDTPEILGLLSYYGRQTDRPERLELVADDNPHRADAISILLQVAENALETNPADEVIGQSSASETNLTARWRFPDDTPVADRRRIMAERRRGVLLDQWPGKPLAALEKKSPLEASSDAALVLPLTAALLLLEQSAAGSVDPSVFAELHEKLGVAPRSAIDPANIDAETIPLGRIARVDLTSASDEVVFTLYKRCEMSGATEVALPLAREAIKRPSLEADLPPEEVYARLAALEPDVQDALSWIDTARQRSDRLGQSNAGWDLAELELRVVEGEFDAANALVQHLREQHIREEGVAERLYRLLYALGAIPAAGEAGATPAEPVVAASAEPVGAANESKLWTPGDSESGGGGQKIWTPS